MLNKSIYQFMGAVLLMGCFFISACENDPKVVDEFFLKKTAVEEAYGVDSYMSQDAKMKARLTAPYMKRYLVDSPYLEFPKSLHVDFYDDSTRIESTLDALYARHMEVNRKVLLRDSIVVINKAKGDTLRTSELWWDMNRDEFYTDKEVRIYQRDKTIFGKGLKAAQNFGWWDIFQVTGIVLTSESGMPE